MKEINGIYFTERSGRGKSTYVSKKVDDFYKRFPNGWTVANQHFFEQPNFSFKQSQFVYSPLGFIPNWLLEKSEKEGFPILYIVDDNENIKSKENFRIYLDNVARKANIQIVVVGHYYTSVSRAERKSFLFRVVVNYRERYDILEFLLILTENDSIITQGIFTNISECFNWFDTKEVVPIATPSIFESELRKHTRNYQDLEQYLRLFYKSDSKYEKKLKEFSQKFGFDVNLHNNL